MPQTWPLNSQNCLDFFWESFAFSFFNFSGVMKIWSLIYTTYVHMDDGKKRGKNHTVIWELKEKFCLSSPPWPPWLQRSLLRMLFLWSWVVKFRCSATKRQWNCRWGLMTLYRVTVTLCETPSAPTATSSTIFLPELPRLLWVTRSQNISHPGKLPESCPWWRLGDR